MKRTNAAVLCTSVPYDGVRTDDETRPVLPGGQWILEIALPALRQAGFSASTPDLTSSGYTAVTLRRQTRSFALYVSDLHPIYVCEVMEPRTCVEWLLRAPRDPQFQAAFDAACTALEADPRVIELRRFSGGKVEGDAFVGDAIEALERRLGIYSR